MVALRTVSEEIRCTGDTSQRAFAEKLRLQSAESLIQRPSSNFAPRKSGSGHNHTEIAHRINALESWTKSFGKDQLSGALLSRLRETGTGILFEPIVLVDGNQRALGCLAEGLRTFEVESRTGLYKLSSIFSRFRLGPVIEALARRGLDPTWLDKQMEMLLRFKSE